MRLIVSAQQAGSNSATGGPPRRFRLALLCFVAMVTFLVPVAQAAAANFPLTIATEGEGSGTIECEVEEEPAEPCAAEYPEETEIAFVAEPDLGSEFSEWGGDCLGQAEECELTIDEAKLVTAVFELEEVPLEVATEGEGLGEIECEVGSGPETCETEYPFGTEVTFLAEPEEGSEFVEWEGDCSGSGACELTMDEEHSVTAVFDLAHFVLEVELEGTGSGTVTSEPAGIDCGTECEAEYLEGEEVVLSAEADPGSEFVEWTGCDAEPSAEECEVTITEDTEVTAVFALVTFTLEVEVEGSGSGTVTGPEDINCPGTCSGTYNEGETITLTAAPSAGSEFAGWTGCDAEPTATECEVTIEEDTTVTATFELEPTTPEFTLKVERKGSGSGSVTSSPTGVNCGPTCSAKFEEGEVVTLTASPGAGSEFAGWTGCDAEPTATECEVTIEEDTTVTATFEAEPPSEFALTVVPAGTGSGTVTSSPAGINCGIDCSEAYAAGTEVTLTATPASGSSFAGWSGSCTGTGSCKVTMSQARSVTATFTKESTPPPPGSGIVSVASTAKVKSGKALLKLTCNGEGPCKGSLKLTAKIKSGGKTKNLTIGKGSFNLAAGAKTTLKVKLSGPAKKAVAKKPLKAKVKGSGVRSSTVKLKK
jgi:hypothetical protein